MALIDHFTLSWPKTPGTRFVGFGALLKLWRSRKALAKLDKHQLDDIAVTPEAAEREAHKPVWDVPNTWKNL
ncbi:hypothetical protein KX928_06975 [Roseobacter sp. YSTF-M11]|uniref:YjiS-like domain-containing protein n=1 Tax=Roseobacter insulae TaxID=2859783 RepID=A0A9X1FU95_9RHOB|nr:hypothetical protein [Roseobacter insulae]MBW4707524.1 hypothetical protein [Roseobacter insulae]